MKASPVGVSAALVLLLCGPPVPAGAEPVGRLQEYLAFDTSNPPGGERPAIEYLASLLASRDTAGEVEVRILSSPGGRANLYARLPASGAPARGALLLLHHADVVPAGDGWSRPPFGGVIGDGMIWGRGAIDAKGLGIAHLEALLHVLDSGRPRQRDLILVAAADEEAGGAEGVGWLLDEHEELFVGVDAVLNEGGGNRAAGERLLWWGVEIAQKQALWLRVTASGRGGHGAGLNPSSPTHRLLRALDRVLEMDHPWRVTSAAHASYRALAALHSEEFARVFDRSLDDVQAELDRRLPSGNLDRILLPGMSASFRDTLQVTRIDNGAAPVNVVPGEASALIDARLLPDTDVDVFRRRVDVLLGSGIHAEELLRTGRSPASSTDSDVYRGLERVLGVRAPVVPMFISGATDSRFFRSRGVNAYGFSPFVLRPGEGGGVHGANERIRVDDFLRGCEMMRRVVAELVVPEGRRSAERDASGDALPPTAAVGR